MDAILPNPGERPWLGVGWVTVVVFVATGTVVGLAEAGILFREALVVGAPALIATLLVDTFLYNEFLIRTGRGFWVLLSAFLFVQSGLVAACTVFLARWVSRREGSNRPANE